MSNTLKLVLTDHWFEEIKSGRKTHEYRQMKTYWNLRLINTPYPYKTSPRIREKTSFDNMRLVIDGLYGDKANPG